MKTILELMAALAQQSADRRPHGSILYGDPCAELVDAVADPATGSTRVRFVFDFMVRHGTQSGSDTYYHHVFVATAELRAGRVVASHIEHRRKAYVSEYDVEWAPPGRRYDPDVLRRDVGEQWRREFQPAP